ncbi:hypothetical protein MNV49_004353 [Pseudohyphozyma bogoriensis]|nr:hypothetical protein MNV49_004353 [Pseudohyphozyma bogoriensis]
MPVPRPYNGGNTNQQDDTAVPFLRYPTSSQFPSSYYPSKPKPSPSKPSVIDLSHSSDDESGTPPPGNWILPDLPVVTKILLRHEMARPVSSRDESGFIYCHEMVEKKGRNSLPPTGPRTTFLKVGRSVKPVSRLAQWRSQCPSREPIVRDIFPRAANSASGGAGISGALRVADQGLQYHHRWERLMLIEVAGRAAKEAEEREKLLGGGFGSGKSKKVCADCGKAHVELFEVNAGAYEDWVQDVIERWGRWVSDVLG